MKILVVGSGGREHSLVAALSENNEIICAPGNVGIAQIAKCFPIKVDDILGLVKLSQSEKVDLVVIGPEIPLSLGLADELRKLNIPAFGPNQSAAQLEASKAFSKDFMARHNIPTAKYGIFKNAEAATEFLMTLSPPYVLKASGLAAGKGVVIAPNLIEAIEEVEAMLSGKFGEASNELVIEEFMQGEEASFFVICNSQSKIYLPICQDHKRAFDNDEGPNTGGMGAYAPTKLVNEIVLQKIIDEIAIPSIEGMKAENNPYNGILYIGLMIENNIPRVVEYNCRFGDPECQILMQFLGNDFAQCLYDIACEKPASLQLKDEVKSAAIVVMAARGYPDEYEKLGKIDNLEAACQNANAFIYHAGTIKDDKGQLRANGGRVLNIVACGDNLQNSLNKIYNAIDIIDAPSLFYRKDIGQKELLRNQ